MLYCPKMDNNRPAPEIEHAREVFRKGLGLMALDADVEQLVLGEVNRFFEAPEPEEWAAFAA